MNLNKLLTITVSTFAVFGLSAESIKVGTMNGPEIKLVETAAKIAKEKYDLDVEIIGFDDYVTPNISLADGSIDANAFQHVPYLKKMINERGFKLAPVGNTFVYPIGAYSQKIKDIKELKKGATIAFPNDPTNEARALAVLHKAGLIKLKDVNNLEASILDVAENPNEYEFKEIEAPQLPRVLPEVDLAFINSNFAVPANLIPGKDSILIEDKDSPYVNVIAAREEDKNKEAILNFVKAFQTEEVQKVADEVFKGAAVKGW